VHDSRVESAETYLQCATCGGPPSALSLRRSSPIATCPEAVTNTVLRGKDCDIVISLAEHDAAVGTTDSFKTVQCDSPSQALEASRAAKNDQLASRVACRINRPSEHEIEAASHAGDRPPVGTTGLKELARRLITRAKVQDPERCYEGAGHVTCEREEAVRLI